MLFRYLSFLALILFVSATQIPLRENDSFNTSESESNQWTANSANTNAFSDSAFFTPLESLSFVKEEEFSVLQHPFFPRYSVRIKKSDFCDPTVNVYTGYIDIEARHLFFYFFESRSNPDEDDVIFWTNGGPGCSSSLGLFMELGPCRVIDADGDKFHPESWNTNANIFFIDQPIGVGFSYAEYGEKVSTSEEAAADVAAFVSIFFENFSRFKGRPFHMAGESYGGRYLPLFASAVYDQNTALVKAGLTPVNLVSVMIGNGITDYYTMMMSYFDMTCTPASVEPVLPIGTCVAMKSILPRCKKWTQKSCIDHFDAIDCGAASEFCSEALSSPFWDTDRNPYDISVKCNGSVSTNLCYPQTTYIRQFLDIPSVRSKIGVDNAHVPTNFSSCNDIVGANFNAAQDTLHPTAAYVAALLERGVRVLIYVGNHDWICNWVGNERWTLALEWSGKKEFGEKELREWVVDGKRAGRTRGARGFTFATVEGAGHMVPFDKPKESLKLVQRWISGEEL